MMHAIMLACTLASILSVTVHDNIDNLGIYGIFILIE